jgi:hypothetical protein
MNSIRERDALVDDLKARLALAWKRFDPQDKAK